MALIMALRGSSLEEASIAELEELRARLEDTRGGMGKAIEELQGELWKDLEEREESERERKRTQEEAQEGAAGDDAGLRRRHRLLRRRHRLFRRRRRRHTAGLQRRHRLLQRRRRQRLSAGHNAGGDQP